MAEPEVTLKNTKAEILDALNAALQRAEAAEKGKLNPEKMEKERVEKRVIATAHKAVEQNIFSKEITDKWNDLQAAISAEENRLQELYGVGRELQKLALIIESGKERLSEIEAEKEAKTEEAKTSLERLRTEYTQKKTELQEEYEAAAKKIKQDRTREQEEYDYNLKRTRAKEDNDWTDEKSAREGALSKKEEQAAALLAEAEAKAEYIKILEAKVEGIPALLEAEKEAAISAVTASLTKEYEHKTQLAGKDYEGTIARLNDKIVYMEKELEIAGKTNLAMQSKLDKAYTEMKELATKTVESASGVKILGAPEGKA